MNKNEITSMVYLTTSINKLLEKNYRHRLLIVEWIRDLIA